MVDADGSAVERSTHERSLPKHLRDLSYQITTDPIVSYLVLETVPT